MQLQEQIISAIQTTLRNPIYQTMQLLNIKTILKSANFVKKDLIVNMGAQNTFQTIAIWTSIYTFLKLIVNKPL